MFRAVPFAGKDFVELELQQRMRRVDDRRRRGLGVVVVSARFGDRRRCGEEIHAGEENGEEEKAQAE